MKILITGDFGISQPYNQSKISRDIIELFQETDLNIINLEAPVTDSNSKILKIGPHLKAERESTQKVLKALNTHIVTLANNHILDYDENGVKDTLNFCEENNIQTVGAGMSLKEASEILYIETPAGKIAIVNFAENEWASAAQNTAGANPMDTIANINQIKEAKEKADFVIVIVHGGHLFYNLPSPRMKKQYRFYIENGADLIVGHHPHCVSGFEEYMGKYIYYSLGNFVFTKTFTQTNADTGQILELNISQNQKITSKTHFIIVKKDFSIRFPSQTELIQLKNETDSYNQIINSDEKLNLSWLEYINRSERMYLSHFSPVNIFKNKYLRYLFNKTQINLLSKHSAVMLFHILNCESHLDSARNILRTYINKKLKK